MGSQNSPIYGTPKTDDLKTISLTLPLGHEVDFCFIECYNKDGTETLFDLVHLWNTLLGKNFKF